MQNGLELKIANKRDPTNSFSVLYISSGLNHEVVELCNRLDVQALPVA